MLTRKNNDNTLVAGEEAGCSEGAEASLPPPPRQLRVAESGEREVMQPAKTLRVLARVSLVLAGIIFFCQVSEDDLLLLRLEGYRCLTSLWRINTLKAS